MAVIVHFFQRWIENWEEKVIFLTPPSLLQFYLFSSASRILPKIYKHDIDQPQHKEALVIPTPGKSLGSNTRFWRKAVTVCCSVLTSWAADFSLSPPLFSSGQQSARLTLWWLSAKLTGESTYERQISYHHESRNAWGEEKDKCNNRILSQRLECIKDIWLNIKRQTIKFSRS